VPTVVGPFSGIINALASIPVLGGRPGAIGIPQSNPVNAFDYDTYANGITSQQIRDMGVSGQLDWDLGVGKLTSITAWRDNTIQAGNDVEYTGAALASQPATQANETDFKQFSQELRFAGKDGPLSWLVGGFFSSEILTPHSTFYAGPQFEPYIGGVASAAATGTPDFLLVSQLTGKPPGSTYIPGVDGQADYFLQTDKSYALFTDETYTIVPDFDVTAGIRYTREQKTADSHYNDPDGGAGCTSLLTSPGLAALGPASPAYQFLLGYGCATAFNPFFTNLNTVQSLDEGKATGTIKFSYHVTQDLMAYASWADGYKAGGFNLARVVNPAAANPLAPVTNTGYPDETVNSYELGFKSTLAQNTLRLNLALFDEQYRNLQLNTYNGIEFIVTSLPRVESKGAEVDVDWLTPLSGFSLSGGVVYAFTNIDEFGTAIATFDPERLNNRLVFAPLWSGSLSATYQIPLSASLVIRAIATEKYNSSYNTDSSLNPVNLQSGYGILNARLGIGAPDSKWSVELWADNVADKGYKQIAFAAPFQYNAYDAFLGDPRTFGVTFRVKL
jgi:outer membrane receptor protein involved in Fe transport